MARDVCIGVIFTMASVVVQAILSSGGSECPSDEVSLFQNLKERKGLHKTSVLATSSASEKVISSRLTNGGTITLQGRVVPMQQSGVPMSCDVPMCSRSCSEGAECCATQMFNALSEITSWMKKNDVEYSVLFGTLLGAHRDKDIIQWTGDVDIGIYSKDVQKLIAQKDIPWSFGYQDSFVIPRGCENHHAGFPGEYSKFQMPDKGFCNGGDAFCSYYIDLYVLDLASHGGDIAKNCIASSLDAGGHLKKTVVEIRGKEFDAPAEVEDCLVARYGSDWKTPDQGKNFNR